MCAPNRRVDAYNKAAGRELYIVADGLRIAKRGQIGTPHVHHRIFPGDASAMTETRGRRFMRRPLDIHGGELWLWLGAAR